jgi:hypothetical protein
MAFNSDLSRRSAIKTLGTVAIASVAPVSADASQTSSALDAAMLQAVADAVLPEALGDAGRRRIVANFQRWLSQYRERADTDHGYGTTRIRATGPSPATRYPGHLAALDKAARESAHAAPFAALTIDARRAVLADQLTAAHVDWLAARPTGAHIASDLMAFYFNSSEAADLCYRARIGRDACRGLDGSDRLPEPLK